MKKYKTNIDLRDVVRQGEFFGDIEKIKQIPPVYSGEWSVEGPAKVLTDKNGDSIVWWQDTGDVLSVHRALSHARNEPLTSEVDQPKMPRTWCTYESKALGSASLPEIIFRDPVYYFNRLARTLDAPNQYDLSELKEIREKLSSIRIPEAFPTGSYVLHSFRPGYIYDGFSIETKRVEHIRGRGYAVVDDKIDLLWCDTGCVVTDRNETPLPSLLKIVDADMSAEWDRQRCEAFFNDETNFVR